jgi:hypothetical protein
VETTMMMGEEATIRHLKGGKWKYMESVVTFPTPIFVTYENYYFASTFYKVKYRFNKLNILEY